MKVTVLVYWDAARPVPPPLPILVIPPPTLQNSIDLPILDDHNSFHPICINPRFAKYMIYTQISLADAYVDDDG